MPTLDYASLSLKPYWLSHPIFGDPSFDAFTRRPRNPLCRGVPGLEWPVNGFLFADPRSGNWFLYVGHYPRGYAAGPQYEPSRCTVYRSTDAGASWTSLGSVFPPEPFTFEGDAVPVGSAPDVSVVYADGRYHMAYDWSLAGMTWDDARTRASGVGYAWSDCPEGPFIRHPQPILRNDLTTVNPILDKYNRLYASTLIRRAADWLLLTIMDSGPHFAWGLVGMVADCPEGPYRDLTPLFHVEGRGYQPPLMEYFPAFVHEGFIYAPSTSVALNRSFQMLQRAPVDEALRPESWEIVQLGSFYHGVDLACESAGIWGQTFTGFVDGQGTFQIMFPSKDLQDCGTINLASRPWRQPYRDQGFILSAHGGPSLALLTVAYQDFILDAEFELTGAAAFFWAGADPLGPHAPMSDATLHPLSLPHGPRLHLTPTGWEVLSAPSHPLASGALPAAPRRSLQIERCKGGEVCIVLDGSPVWAGAMLPGAGLVGILLEPRSALTVNRFVVNGQPHPAALSLLYTEALVGAGQNMTDWQELRDADFRFGVGAWSKVPGARAKWNFAGTGFTLWSPRAPSFGAVKVFVDDRPAVRLNLAASLKPSEPVLTITGLPDGFHAVTLKAVDRALVVDSLEVHCPLPET